MHKSIRLTSAATMLALATMLAAPGTTRAQLPVSPDKALGIFQKGIFRGEVMRVDGDDRNYVEHWVLYPDYVYPGADNRITTELVPAVKPYDGLDDFFARVPFEKGARYVRVTCEDGTVLPNGRAAGDPPTELK